MSQEDLTFGVAIKSTGDGSVVNEAKSTREELERLKASTDEVATSTGKMAGQYSGLKETLSQHNAAVAETAGNVTKLLDRYDPLGAKLRQLQADFKALDSAASSGNIAGRDDARVDAVYAKIQQEIKMASGAASEFGVVASGSMEKVEWATKRAQQEMVVLGREVVRGDFARMPSALSIIAQGLSPVALGIAGITVALGAGAYAWYKWGEDAEVAGKKAAEAATGRVVAAMGAAEKAKQSNGPEKIAGINKEIEQLEIENASLKREMDRLRVASATWSDPKGNNDDVASQLVASEIFANKERIAHLKQNAQEMQGVLDKSAEQARKTAEKSREHAEKEAERALEHNEALKQKFIQGDEQEFNRKKKHLDAQLASEAAHTARLVAGQEKKFEQYRMRAEDAAANDLQRAKLKQSRELSALELDRFIMVNDHKLTLAEIRQFEDAKAQIILGNAKNISEARVKQEDWANTLFRSFREGDYKNALDVAEKQTAGLSRTSRAAFEINKTAALAKAAVSLPSAVMQSFDNGGGYPWGLIPAGLMLAEGLMQIDAISGSSFEGGKTTASVGGGAASYSPASNPTPASPAPAIPTPLGIAAQAPQNINITIVGNESTTFSYDQVVNQLIPAINQAAGNGINIMVTG